MSMGAVPGTGPSTGPITVVRKATPRASFENLPTDRTLVMGILNVTDNSFSDGGEHFAIDNAIDHGLRMHYVGADIIDVGGESTAPGNEEVDVETELGRVMPVVEALVRAGAMVSVDTRHTETARKVLGISNEIIINDVSGLSVEAEMPALIAETGAKYIVMHNRGNSTTMDKLTDYNDVVADVVAETKEIADKFLAAGAKPEQLIVDPGLGFSKIRPQSWQLLNHLDAFFELGYPVLVGASRKRFVGVTLTEAGSGSAAGAGKAVAPKDRDSATVAVSALSAAAGAWAVRVHDVRPNLDAVKIGAAWANAQ